MKLRLLGRSPLTALVVAIVVALGTAGIFVGRAEALRARANVETFSPSSLSFITPDRGWVLGSIPCPSTKGCLGMRSTRDGGQRWSRVTLPLGLDAQVRKGDGPGAYGDITDSMEVHFADARNGWIYNTELPILWSTHDGGKAWNRISLAHVGKYGSIFDVESSGRTVYVIAAVGNGRATLFRSSITNDSWSVVATALNLPAGGANPGGTIVLKGASGWLVVGNDRGVSAALTLDARGKWVTWTPPCEEVGNSYFVPVAITIRELAVVCTMGGFASPLSKTAPPGAKLFSNWLYLSSNAGHSFHYGPALGHTWDPELLASPSPHVLLLVQFNVDKSNLYRIIRSVDGGWNWSVVYRGGWALSVSFPSAERGLVLVQKSAGNDSLLVSDNGGIHWSQVSFSS